MRYVFHFTYLEVSLFNTGYLIPFLINLANNHCMKHYLQHLGVESPSDQQTTRLYCLSSMLVNVLVFGVILLVFRLYIKHYIDNREDLLGTTDTIRAIVRDSRATPDFEVWRDIWGDLALPSCMILLQALLAEANFRFLRNYAHLDADPWENKLRCKALHCLADLAGRLLGLTGLIPQFSYLMALLMFQLGITTFLGVDYFNYKQGLLMDRYHWIGLFVLASMLSGLLLTNVISLTAVRTEFSKKMNAGQTIFVVITASVFYCHVMSYMVFGFGH